MTRRMNIHLLLAGLAMLKEGLLRCCCCRVEREVISDLCGISSWWAMKIFSSLSFFLESGHLQSNWYRKQQESERESGLSNLQAHLCDWNWLTSTSISSSLKCYWSSWFSCCAVFKNQELKKITVYSSSVGCAWNCRTGRGKDNTYFQNWKWIWTEPSKKQNVENYMYFLSNQLLQFPQEPHMFGSTIFTSFLQQPCFISHSVPCLMLR